MEPKIYSREELLIAGVSGSGDETGKVWEAYMKLEKISPLENVAEEIGYEVRMYPGGVAPGEVHVGMSVKDTGVPAEYKIVSLPASLYAEFIIYPAKGWESSNAEMNKWLSENAEKYKQAYLGNKAYAIEIYDERYKGDKDPKSVVGIMVPIIPVN